MNPANKLTNHVKDITEKNLFVETWVEDAISLVQPLLLSFFNDYIRSLIETLRTRIRNREGGLSNLNNIGKVVFSDFLFNRQSRSNWIHVASIFTSSSLRQEVAHNSQDSAQALHASMQL